MSRAISACRCSHHEQPAAIRALVELSVICFHVWNPSAAASNVAVSASSLPETGYTPTVSLGLADFPVAVSRAAGCHAPAIKIFIYSPSLTLVTLPLNQHCRTRRSSTIRALGSDTSSLAAPRWFLITGLRRQQAPTIICTVSTDCRLTADGLPGTGHQKGTV